MVLVDLTLATICFLGNCYPALVGNNTPVGTFVLQQRYVAQPGYGGDVLQFDEDGTGVFSVHRVYTLNKQRRVARLASDKLADRMITDGCINIDSKVYDALVDCCAESKILITKGP